MNEIEILPISVGSIFYFYFLKGKMPIPTIKVLLGSHLELILTI